jgi:hypothetical protein
VEAGKTGSVDWISVRCAEGHLQGISERGWVMWGKVEEEDQEDDVAWRRKGILSEREKREAVSSSGGGNITLSP